MKKKLIALTPLIIVLFMFIGCAARQTENSEPEGSTAQSPSETDFEGEFNLQTETDESGNPIPITTNAPETTIIVVEGGGTTATIIATVTTTPSESGSVKNDGDSGKIGSVTSPISTSTDQVPAETTTTPPVTIKASEIDYPSIDTLFGSLSIDSIGIKLDLYFGDSQSSLRKGLGMHTGSFLPGAGGRMIIGGHNTVDMLRDIGNVAVGDTIKIETTYGSFLYEIVSTKIALDTDASAIAIPKGEEYLILYTCYPFNSLFTADRFYVRAKKISGPVLVR